MKGVSYLARRGRLSRWLVLLAATISACASTSVRTHTTAFAITSASPDATVCDLQGDVLGACPLEGQIHWEEVVRLGQVSGRRDRTIRAVAGEAQLVDIETQGNMIRIFLAGSIDAPGKTTRAFRELIGSCSPDYSKVEADVRIHVNMEDGSDALASSLAD